jgi:hypothetical protein
MKITPDHRSRNAQKLPQFPVLRWERFSTNLDWANHNRTALTQPVISQRIFFFLERMISSVFFVRGWLSALRYWFASWELFLMEILSVRVVLSFTLPVWRLHLCSCCLHTKMAHSCIEPVPSFLNHVFQCCTFS